MGGAMKQMGVDPNIKKRIGMDPNIMKWMMDPSKSAGMVMELDRFILWTHCARMGPVSKLPVRVWKPFDGLQ
eukprot:4665546-Alexandrium_andersonii.AAC.1